MSCILLHIPQHVLCKPGNNDDFFSSSDADSNFLRNLPSEPRPCNREYMKHEIKTGPEDITH